MKTEKLIKCRDCGAPMTLHRNPKGRFSRRELCHACAGEIHATQGRMRTLKVSKLAGGKAVGLSLGGRPRTLVDIEKVQELSALGWGCKAITSELTRQGQPVSYSTIRRRLQKRDCGD